MLSSAEQNKFHAESSKVAALEVVEFLMEVVVTEKEAKSCFLRIENIFNDLQKVTQNGSIPEAKIQVCDPAEKSKRFKKFSIQTESGLKERMSVSLQLRVLIVFDKPINFWQKGLFLASAIDILESFCESNRKEKHVVTRLEWAQLPEEKAKDADPS